MVFKSKYRSAILKIFTNNPNSAFYMREIGRILKKEPGVFQRTINALVREGILKSEYRANARFFSFNKPYEIPTEQDADFNTQLNILINSATDRICSRDTDGALLAWNKAFADSIKYIFGIEPYVGLKTWELIPSDQQEKLESVRETFQRVFAGETVTTEFDYKMPDGTVHRMESSWVPLWKEDEVYAVGEVTRDITNRKRRSKK